MVRITDEEFRRVGDKQAAVMGAASVCWTPAPAGVFDSEAAADVADDLVRYLTVPADLSAHDAMWLDSLIDQAVPREPGGPTDWEGDGRAHAKKILSRIIDGATPANGPSLMGSDL
jgi:hypothetical protein